MSLNVCRIDFVLFILLTACAGRLGATLCRKNMLGQEYWSGFNFKNFKNLEKNLDIYFQNHYFYNVSRK